MRSSGESARCARWPTSRAGTVRSSSLSPLRYPSAPRSCLSPSMRPTRPLMLCVPATCGAQPCSSWTLHNDGRREPSGGRVSPSLSGTGPRAGPVPPRRTPGRGDSKRPPGSLRLRSGRLSPWPRPSRGGPAALASAITQRGYPAKITTSESSEDGTMSSGMNWNTCPSVRARLETKSPRDTAKATSRVTETTARARNAASTGHHRRADAETRVGLAQARGGGARDRRVLLRALLRGLVARGPDGSRQPVAWGVPRRHEHDVRGDHHLPGGHRLRHPHGTRLAGRDRLALQRAAPLEDPLRADLRGCAHLPATLAGGLRDERPGRVRTGSPRPLPSPRLGHRGAQVLGQA